MPSDVFDIDRVNKKDLKFIADSLDEFVDFMTDIVIYPKEIDEEHGKKLRKGFEEVRKMSKGLREGKMKYFKDIEDCEQIMLN
jgi:hypothetical protein